MKNNKSKSRKDQRQVTPATRLQSLTLEQLDGVAGGFSSANPDDGTGLPGGGARPGQGP